MPLTNAFQSLGRARRGALAALIAVSAFACSTGDVVGSRPRALGVISQPHRTMSAMIDGKEWKADWVQASAAPWGLQILASMDGGRPDMRAITMSFSPRRLGRQALGFSQGSRAILHVGAPEITWNTFGDEGSGEVVILTVSST